MKRKNISTMLTRFELRTSSARRVAFVDADNIESVFEMNGRLILITKDGKEFKFDHMEYVLEQERSDNLNR